MHPHVVYHSIIYNEKKTTITKCLPLNEWIKEDRNVKTFQLTDCIEYTRYFSNSWVITQLKICSTKNCLINILELKILTIIYKFKDYM